MNTTRERRFYHRQKRSLRLYLRHGSRTFPAPTVNLCAGGAWVATGAPLPVGRTYTFFLPEPGQPTPRVVLRAEAIHDVAPTGHTGAGLGVRWTEAHTAHPPEVLEQFLERVLGIVHHPLRADEVGAQRVTVFDFPDLVNPAPAELDALRALSPEDIAASSRATTGRPHDAAPHAEPGAPSTQQASAPPDTAPHWWQRLRHAIRREPHAPPINAQESQSSNAPPGPPGPLPATRDAEALGAIRAHVDAGKRHLPVTVVRLGLASARLRTQLDPPAVYERIVLHMQLPSPSGDNPVPVTIHATVTRLRDAHTFSVRFLRVDEGRHHGALGRFIQSIQ